MRRTVDNYRRQDTSWTKAAEKAGAQTERTALRVAPAKHERADMEYGTGVVKITPAHDQNDEESAQKTAN